MKIGIMGGTFDPIHIGHLLAGEAARDAYGLDQVWFMPSHIPPHKHQAGASGKERLEMTSEAVAGHPAFEVLDIEVLRGEYLIPLTRSRSFRSCILLWIFILLLVRIW